MATSRWGFGEVGRRCLRQSCCICRAEYGIQYSEMDSCGRKTRISTASSNLVELSMAAFFNNDTNRASLCIFVHDDLQLQPCVLDDVFFTKWEALEAEQPPTFLLLLCIPRPHVHAKKRTPRYAGADPDYCDGSPAPL